MSSKPLFVSKPTLAPRRRMTVFEASVVACASIETPASVAPDAPHSSRIAARAASSWRSLVSTFVDHSEPVTWSSSTPSVNVPPMSTPMMTTAATSATCPSLAAGLIASARRRPSSSPSVPHDARVISVSIGPGHTTLTRSPLAA